MYKALKLQGEFINLFARNYQQTFNIISQFTYAFKITIRSTRRFSNNNIFLPSFDTPQTQQSIKYGGAKIWNGIPDIV